MPTLNLFAGAETGGLEEALSAGYAWSVSSNPTVSGILVKDFYSYVIDAPGTINSITFDMDGFVAFENTNLIVSFVMGYGALPSTGEETFVNIGNAISISASSTGTFTLYDSNSSSLDTFSASVDTAYEIEIYVQKDNASGAWEWRINGTSQGSGTGADLAPASVNNNLIFSGTNSAVVLYVNNIVVRSGCTASNWLGTGISVCSLATPLGTPTEGGDTLSSGAMVNTQNIPLDATEAQFDAGTSKSRWVQSDGNRALIGYYYFDASDAGPTDNDAVWTDDALAFNGSQSDAAQTTTVGTETTNELRAEGTNAPANGTIAISSVSLEYRWGASPANNTNYVRVYVDGGTELIGDFTFTKAAQGSFVSTVSLNTPTGGWTWTKLAGLEVVIWLGTTGVTLDVLSLRLYVTASGLRTPTDLGLTNTIGCKVLMDS